MFIVNELHKFFSAPEERNVAEANLAFDISLRWSSWGWVTSLFYKHSAPPELSTRLRLRPCKQLSSYHETRNSRSELYIVSNESAQNKTG
jgi:hypothetical protein